MDKQKEQAEIQRKRIDSIENNYLKKLSGSYARTRKSVIKEFKAFYSNYDNPTYSQATQLLPVNESELIKEDAQKESENVYRGNAVIKKDLENYSNKPRLTRLDELLIAITILYARIGNVQNKGMNTTLGNVAQDQYSRAMWNLSRAQGFSKVLPPMSSSKIDAILRMQWSGANFSERLWGNTQRVATTLKQQITEGIIRGDSTQQISRILQGTVNSSYSAAERLVRTEMTRVASEADKQVYLDNDITYYTYVATLDDRTSDICGQLDGQRIKMSEMEVGVNAPPMHPNCRSTTIADIGSLAQQQRRAKDAAGNSILVPANMSYSEWKKEMKI